MHRFFFLAIFDYQSTGKLNLKLIYSLYIHILIQRTEGNLLYTELNDNLLNELL